MPAAAWEMPQSEVDATSMPLGDRRSRSPFARGESSAARSSPAKVTKRTDQAFAPTLDAEDDENEDQNIGRHMISQVAWLSTAMREVMAMLICVVLIPASSPLVTALAKIGETYARLVKEKKGAHPDGPPHIQKAICLVNFLSNIPNCTNVKEQATVKALQASLNSCAAEDACDFACYCRTGLCFLPAGQQESERKFKIMYRMDFTHPLGDVEAPMCANEAMMVLLKGLGAAPKWAPAPPQKSEREIRYALSKMFA